MFTVTKLVNYFIFIEMQKLQKQKAIQSKGNGMKFTVEELLTWYNDQ